MNCVHIAWLGEQNFGDDIMAIAVSNYLRNHFKRFNHAIWCANRPRLPFTHWVYPVKTNTLLDNYWENRSLKKADVLLIGGGSVLHSAKSSNWKRKVADRFKKTGSNKKTLGIGLSVGPFDAPDDEAACRDFLRSLDACALRDRFSYDFAVGCGLNYKPVLSFDLAACYLEDKKIKSRENKRVIETVGVCVRLPYRADIEIVTKNYISLLRGLGRKFPKIKLFSFTAKGSQCDFGYCRELADASGLDNLQIIRYTGNDEDFTNQIKSCDFFISTKLHGIILPYLLNIPFIAISYQKKFEDFADYIGLSNRYLFQQSSFDPQAVISAIEPYNLNINPHVWELARKNFSVFDAIN